MNDTVVKSNKFDAGAATERGSINDAVSSQWFNRPADQRFLNLNDLYAATRKAATDSYEMVVDPRAVKVEPDRETEQGLTLIVPGERPRDGQYRGSKEYTDRAEPNHWSFGQLCRLVKAPTAYLRELPATIAAINLQYGFSGYREGPVKTYTTTNGEAILRAATGPQYGRIFDYELVEAIQKIAGNGIGDSRWKVPGVLDWSTMQYDPDVEVTKESTTLFASDRDVFVFLVDDRNPIKIGVYTDPRTGEEKDDLVFRGFYAWNSEVGRCKLGVASFYLRAVCQNRCLWGVEGFEEISIRHSKYAPDRFAEEIRPALESFANHDSRKVLSGVDAARKAIVAKDDDDAAEFLGKKGFTKKQVKDILQLVADEEGHPARSVWDMVQGITAKARTSGHQDQRIALEQRAGALLDKVA